MRVLCSLCSLIFIFIFAHTNARKSADDRWRYKCEYNRCVRVKEDANNWSLDTCNMLCFEPQLWPKPSSVTYSPSQSRNERKSVIFFPQQLFFKTFAPKEVRLILNEAYAIFYSNVYNLIDKDNNVEEENYYAWTNKEKEIKQFTINVYVNNPSLELTLDTIEKYTLAVNHDVNLNLITANITADSYFGARHGLETLSQLIWWDNLNEALRVITKIEIKDAPKFPYRGLMVDTARNYFEIHQLKKVIEGMAANKLNVFHWHITDTQSFPLKTPNTKKFAQFGAYNPSSIYTAEDIQDLVEFAKVRGVRVILEVDAPAHVNRGWEFGPENNLGDLVLCPSMMEGQLNPENQHVLQLLKLIYEDISKLNTNNELFHLGGDEVNEMCWRQKLGVRDTKAYWGKFVMKMLNLTRNINDIKATNKHIIMWSSPLTQPPYLETYLTDKSNIVIQTWLGEIKPIVDQGYKVIFSTVSNWYLDCGFGKWRESAAALCSYKTWHNFYEYTPWIENNCLDRTLGGEVCLWSEQVEQDSLETRIWPRSSAFAERIWSDPKKSRYGTFHETVYTRLDTQRRRMIKRGIKAEGLWPQFCTQNPGLCN